MSCVRAALCALVAASIWSMPARAQVSDFPSQVVKLVIPFGAGSITDSLGRVLAEKLQERWGKQIVIENRPGLPGTASVARSRPDGYTLLLTSNGHVIADATNRNPGFDPIKDFVGITKIAAVPLVLSAAPQLPVASLRELIDLAKSKPGVLNYGSTGLASTTFIAAEIFKGAAGVDIMHIPYRNAADASTSILRGDSSIYFVSVTHALSFNASGMPKPLAIARAARSPALPHVPTFAEAGLPNYAYDAWFGLLAPAGTPPDIIEKIRRDVTAVLRLPDVGSLLAAQGVEVETSEPGAFNRTIETDAARLRRLLKEVGVLRD